MVHKILCSMHPRIILYKRYKKSILSNNPLALQTLKYVFFFLHNFRHREMFEQWENTAFGFGENRD